MMSIRTFFIATLLSLTSLLSLGQELKLGIPIGHLDAVYTAVFSPNGEQVVTASQDETARIWDVVSGKLVNILEGHELIVNSAVFSPDGEQILTAGGDKTARIWDADSGKLLSTLEGHGGWVESAEFSPDGKLVVTASNNSYIHIWDARTRKPLNILKGHKGIVYSAVFSPDGTKIVSASWDKTARIWDVNSGELLNTLEGHTNFVNSAEFSPDGKHVLTASDDYTMGLWDTDSGKLITKLEIRPVLAKSAVFSSDGKQILTACSDNTIRVWDLESGNLKSTLEGHSSLVNSAVYNQDGNQIVSASSDNTARIWDVESGKCTNVLRGYTNSVYSSYFSPDRNQILTASEDNTVRIWSTNSGRLKFTLKERANSARYSPDGKQIISKASNNKKTQIWNSESGKLSSTLEVPKGTIRSFSFSPKGDRVLMVYGDNAGIWDANSGNLLISLEGHSKWVRSAEYSPDGKKILTASGDNTTRIWDANSGNLLTILEGDTGTSYPSVYSPDGKKILTSSWDNTVHVWDAESGKTLIQLNGHPRHVYSAVFSPDGKQILTACGDNVARIWDATSGKLLKILKGHSWVVNSAVYSPDGMQILTSSWDNTVRIWNVESGNLLNTYDGYKNRVNSAIFSSDGKKILTASLDGSLVVGDVQNVGSSIRLFLFDSDPNKWVHLHPSGLFDAAPEAMDLMYWVKGSEVIEFSQLKHRYWQPDLWEIVMNGGALKDVGGIREIKLHPEVELQNITDDSVSIQLNKREGGYGKTTLLINGKEAIEDILPSDMDHSLNEQMITVSIKDHPYLLDGKNEILVKASSEDGFIQGRGSKGTSIFKKKLLKEPEYFGVVIGVGNYANNRINLRYPVSDADAISKAMQLGAKNLFGEERTHIYTITSKGDKIPNKETIKGVFEEISKKAKSEDIITVYLSGHGITWGSDQGDFYFLTSDATATTGDIYNDAVIRKKTTISTSEWIEWLKEIPALKQVMIIDACGSGKAVDNLSSTRNIGASQIKAIDRMKDRTGMHIISGSAADAVSYETSLYGQGLLTYSILQAIKGAALREDKYVDVNTIFNYARETVPKLAEGIGGIQKPQLLIPKGGSFDIGLLDEDDKVAIPLASPKTVFVRSMLFNPEESEDNLELSALLNEKLSIISSMGKNASLVYFDTPKFPDACKISGGYTLVEEGISISLKVKCGDKSKSYQFSEKTPEKLIDKILNSILN